MNILLVDDETDTEFLFKSFFRKEITDNIYEFNFKLNGEEALNFYNANKVDLILTDLNMPIMGGVEFIKSIKKINPAQDIIILSAYDNKENRDFVVEYKNIDFFPKPIDFDKLREFLVNSCKKSL